MTQVIRYKVIARSVKGPGIFTLALSDGRTLKSPLEGTKFTVKVGDTGVFVDLGDRFRLNPDAIDLP